MPEQTAILKIKYVMQKNLNNLLGKNNEKNIEP